jgi:hypothetical protein
MKKKPVSLFFKSIRSLSLQDSLKGQEIKMVGFRNAQAH